MHLWRMGNKITKNSQLKTYRKYLEPQDENEGEGDVRLNVVWWLEKWVMS